jgi:hypothetical protein
LEKIGCGLYAQPVLSSLPPRTLRVGCLIIRMLAIRMPIIYMAITILRGVSVAIVLLTRIARPFRSRLEHNRGGGNHRLFEGGELGVGHVAEPFRYSIGRKVQVQGLRWAAVAAVQQRGSTLEMAASSANCSVADSTGDSGGSCVRKLSWTAVRARL